MKHLMFRKDRFLDVFCVSLTLLFFGWMAWLVFFEMDWSYKRTRIPTHERLHNLFFAGLEICVMVIAGAMFCYVLYWIYRRPVGQTVKHLLVTLLAWSVYISIALFVLGMFVYGLMLPHGAFEFVPRLVASAVVGYFVIFIFDCLIQSGRSS